MNWIAFNPQAGSCWFDYHLWAESFYLDYKIVKKKKKNPNKERCQDAAQQFLEENVKLYWA